MNVNYRQQTPPHLGFYSSSIKKMDYSRHNLRTRHQHKTIPSHAFTTGFKVSTMKLWAIEESIDC